MARSDSRNERRKLLPDFLFEQELIGKGYRNIAGVDEAGRGPLAGPVVVAAVIIDPANIPAGLNDSKKLSALKRNKMFDEIVAATKYSVVSAPPIIIEELNIRGATLWAMRMAVLSLSEVSNFALIDGRDVPNNMPCKAEAVVSGDSRSVSIAAASIIAKVVRDRMCPIMDMDCPGFGFNKHKGYGTKQHMDEMAIFGVTKFHRVEFAPVAKLLNSKSG